MHVVVIGAGLAGLSTAWFLRQGAAEVTLLERGPGPGLETSFANGSLLHPSHVEPWNSPGAWRQVLKSLGRSDSAMVLRWHALPGLVDWGLKFMQESSDTRFRAHTRSNVALANHSLALMREFEHAGVDFAGYRRGSLVVQRSAEALAAARPWSEWLAGQGIAYRVLQTDEVVAMEPALRPVAAELAGAIYQPDDTGADPQRFCRAVAAMLIAQGVTLRYGARVSALVAKGGEVRGLRLDNDETLAFDAVAVCAAAWSPMLARSVGLRLPVVPVKGYSLTLPRSLEGGPDLAPRIPVIDSELRMAVVPVGEDQVRVAGTAEFTGFDASLTPSRVAYLRGLASRLYPAYLAQMQPQQIQPWAGVRPVTPDGVALIGRTPLQGLFLNTGHGHIGWTVAAGGGRLAAQLMLDRTPDIDSAPYDPRRFGGA